MGASHDEEDGAQKSPTQARQLLWRLPHTGAFVEGLPGLDDDCRPREKRLPNRRAREGRERKKEEVEGTPFDKNYEQGLEVIGDTPPMVV